jgi:adenylate kinase
MSLHERAPFRKTETLRSPEVEGHNRIILYTGVSCAGKDHLLNKALSKFQDGAPQRLSVGSFLSGKLDVHRDELRREFGLQEIEQVKMQTVPEIVAAQPAVLVSHVVPKYEHVITLNPDFERALNPTHIIAVVSDPDQINLWREERNKSGERFAPIEDPDAINFHQELVIHNSFLIARSIGSGFSVIYNKPEMLATADNAEFLHEALTQI